MKRNKSVWLEQEDFELLKAEITGRIRYQKGERGPALSCPVKKVLRGR